MSENVVTIAPLPPTITDEAEIQLQAINKLRDIGFTVKQFKVGIATIDNHWPSKSGAGVGEPDLLLSLGDSKKPICVWENKNRSVNVNTALSEAKFYIEGLRSKLPLEPSLPRIAAGFNGQEILLSYYNNENKWVNLKHNGVVLKDKIPFPEVLEWGISSEGIINGSTNAATVKDLRSVLTQLRNAYRKISVLASGRRPIDFTIAILTLKLLVEQNEDWGTWAEQPTLVHGVESRDHAIAERMRVLYDRVMRDRELLRRYGDIFEFSEHSDADEIAFSFSSTLRSIPSGQGHFTRIFKELDSLPPLSNADFDLFGEVYQTIGDEATKKNLGQFFTGRHIISGILPVLFKKSGLITSFDHVKSKKIADIACGTGGFLTETLRFVRRNFSSIPSNEMKEFAGNSFFGYDLSPANASRARVNMYFAGDGFSHVEGNVDTLMHPLNKIPENGFDYILTNPPYGQRNEEQFLLKTIELLKSGDGWGAIVLPVGVIENSRSKDVRFSLLKNAEVKFVVELPKHAFAPYTQQMTAFVIFNKRPNPINVADNDWQELIRQIGNEKVGLFIIDNDGYANSDKRYPTDRKDAIGKWLHNDLADWVDHEGLSHHSVLYDALINDEEPTNIYDEFGVKRGDKYCEKRIRELFVKDDDSVNLLPSKFLRPIVTMIPYSDYVRRAKAVIDSWMSDGDVAIEGGLLTEINELMSFPVEYDSSIAKIRTKIKDLFIIRKGDQQFTEEVIYNYFDREGIPVYGGGASLPKHRVSRNTKRKNGVPINIYSGPAIVVSMDGSSGSMHVVKNGDFCLNHHGAVLLAHCNSIDLEWFVQQAQQGLKSLATNKNGSATLTLPKLESFELDIPIPASLRTQIGDLRRGLDNIRSTIL